MSTRHFKLANIGGTFSVMHEGHQAYIATAFSLADRVQIVINDTGFAQELRPYPVPELGMRVREVISYLRANGWADRVQVLICPQEVREYGAWLDPDLDCVLVSDEIYEKAVRFNGLRAGYGLDRYHIHMQPRFWDPDGNDVSSTKIILAEVGVP